MELTEATPEISLGDDPRQAVDHRVSRRLWAQESTGFVGDFVLVATSDRSVDDPVPRNTTARVGWPLPDRIDDPLGRFVDDRGNPLSWCHMTEEPDWGAVVEVLSALR